jgi:tetratricopeptide (TPR) repeat protein
MEGDHHVLYVQGRAAMEKGDMVQAVELLKRSAELYPHFKTYESIGECLLAQDDFNEAVLYLSASSGLGSKPFRALYLLARALIGTGEPDQARQKLLRALAINSDYRAARELLEQITS